MLTCITPFSRIEKGVFVVLEKEIKILFIRKYDFIDEKTGQHVVGSKCSYHFSDKVSSDFENGYKVNISNLPIDVCDKVFNRLPLVCIGMFSVNNNNELRLVDVK